MIPTEILVPVDMSDLSARALRYASAWALASGARLSVLFVEDLEVPAYLANALEERVLMMRESERRYLRKLLKAFATRYLSPEADAQYLVLRGLPAPMIMRAIKRLNADAVVMGSHSRGGLGRLILGSVTESVIGASDVPVLVVRAIEAEADIASNSPWTVRRILAPVDAASVPGAAYRAAFDLARTFSAKLVALLCYRPGSVGPADDELSLLEERSRFFDKLPRGLRLPAPAVVVRSGDAGEVIVREVQTSRADLLVMGREWPAWALRAAACPVLMVPEKVYEEVPTLASKA